MNMNITQLFHHLPTVNNHTLTFAIPSPCFLPGWFAPSPDSKESFGTQILRNVAIAQSIVNLRDYHAVIKVPSKRRENTYLDSYLEVSLIDNEFAFDDEDYLFDSDDPELCIYRANARASYIGGCCSSIDYRALFIGMESGNTLDDEVVAYKGEDYIYGNYDCDILLGMESGNALGDEVASEGLHYLCGDFILSHGFIDHYIKQAIAALCTYPFGHVETSSDNHTSLNNQKKYDCSVEDILFHLKQPLRDKTRELIEAYKFISKIVESIFLRFDKEHQLSLIPQSSQ